MTGAGSVEPTHDCASPLSLVASKKIWLCGVPHSNLVILPFSTTGFVVSYRLPPWCANTAADATTAASASARSSLVLISILQSLRRSGDPFLAHNPLLHSLKGASMRTVVVFVAGLLVGLAAHAVSAQNANNGIVGMNHVGIAVSNMDEAVAFYTQKM